MGLDLILPRIRRRPAKGRVALMPYFTLGYPDADTSEAVIRAIAAAGADLIELGRALLRSAGRWSDHPALDPGGTGTGHDRRPGCLALTGRLREAGVTQALPLMGYVNPIIAYGAARFVADAAAAGADGLIIPDLPPEEAAAGGAGEIEAACAAHGLALVYLAAPTSSDQRLAMLAADHWLPLFGVGGGRHRRAGWPAA